MRYYIPIVGLTAEELRERFIERIYSIYNLPDSIISNNST